MERNVVMEILRDACKAPSADNIQPWRFVVEANAIRVINAGDQTEEIFNYRQMVNHASLGACIENLRVSAENRGYEVDLKLFPDPHNKLVVADVRLSSGTPNGNELASYITSRATNRKPYLPKQIEPEKLITLSSLETGPGQRIVFVSNKAEVKMIARIISAGEKLVFENKAIHDFLFEHITWTQAEDRKKHGFFIDTFELAPPQKAAFKFFSNWKVLRFFVPLGVANFIANEVRKIHETSSVFGAIIISEKSPEDYLRAGILFEKLWLTVTKLALALQPTTGLHFFAQPILDNNRFGLPKSKVSFLSQRYEELKSAFGANTKETIALAFRLGYGSTPSATTTRFEPDVTWI
jgi:hypothetical protein